jgi:predicted MFS family arabinose efflux permease
MTASRSIAVSPGSESVRPIGGSEESYDEHRLAGYTWYVIGLLTLTSIVSYIDRMAMAVLAPLVQRELHLSDSQLGMLTGLAFSLFYAVCGLPIARWADRGVRRNILSAALTTWSVMTALSGLGHHFWHLFLARVGIGAGEAGCLPAAQSIICDYVPVQRRAGIFAIHNVGNYAGMMLGLILAGWLGQLLGWRLTFVALGLPGIVLALILRFTLIEPKRGTFDAAGAGNESGSSLASVFATLKGCNTYRFLLSFYVLNGFVQYGLIQWWPSFYNRTSNLGLASVGLYLGLAVGGGAAVGSLLGGWIASRVSRRDPRLPLAISAAVTLLAIPAVLASLFTSSIHMSISFVALSALCWSVSNGPVIATAASVVAPTMRATSSSIIIFATAFFGFGLGPLCVGALSDLLTPRFGQDALRYAFLAPICLLPAMAYVLNEASKTAAADLHRMGVRER